MTLPPLVIIPAYQAQGRIGRVVRELCQLSATQARPVTILVVDDGSTDATAQEARDEGAVVLVHERNRGKGAALGTALRWAKKEGFEHAVTADADGQHPTDEILRLVALESPAGGMVLGVRSLARDGAPRKNQFSNGISNFFVSWFTGLPLRDTQCGLRRYPVGETLALGCKDNGFAFETEVILRAARVGMPIFQLPVAVFYPKPEDRLTHFHVVRDPYRIVMRVLCTVVEAS